MLAKGRVLGLAAAVTVMIVAWGVLVFIAIDHGREPRDSAQDWLLLVGATVGAVVCMFLAILSAARLRDHLRGSRGRRDDGPAPALLAPEADEAAGHEQAARQTWIPAQRTAETPQPHYVGANARGRAYAEDEDDSSFLSYAGLGGPAHSDATVPAVTDEPQWANETGEQYYRDLGERVVSRHSAPGSGSRSSASDGAPVGTTTEPPSSVPYATPGKRALR